MYKFLFRTRYGALGFVAVTMLGVTSLVGTDGESGLIQYGVNSFTAQQDAMGEEVGQLDQAQTRPVRRIGAPQPTYPSEVGPSEIGEVSGGDDGFGDEGYEEGSWASDDALIDDASGYDPAPIVATEYNPEDGEIIETVVEGGQGTRLPDDIQ